MTANYEQIVEKVMVYVPGRNFKEKIDNLAKLLGMTDQSIYNKVSNRSRFTVEELFTICLTYKMSIDSIIYGSSSDKSYVPFYGDGLRYSPRSFREYLLNINKYFSQIRSLENVHGYFLANELPFFHILPFHNILYLKFYIWNEFNWKIKGIPPLYNPEMVTKNSELIQESKNAYNLFCSFDSTEIWNPYILDNMLTQFENLIKVGIIRDKEHIKSFVFELNKLIELLETYTLDGHKPQNAKNQTFKSLVHCTDLNLGSEIILVKSNQINFVFQQIDIPNYLRTSDPNMTENVYSYYNASLLKSTCITLTGQLAKELFFANLRRKIELFSDRLK
jgi:hypothetical protein